MTNESDLVPLHMHNLLTAGPAPWTDTRVPSEVWHVARAVYGTSTEDDEKRVYRTLQAALWKLAATQPEAQPQWQPIETAPKDEAVLLYGAKRLEMCVGMNHSRDGWVTDTTSEWMSMYTPTHWMPLPAAPSAQAEPSDNWHQYAAESEGTAQNVIERHRAELGRAYRCIQGMHYALAAAPPMVNEAYHAVTIAAAKRFVFEGAMDGSDYFVGKPAGVLHAALALPAQAEQKAGE